MSFRLTPKRSAQWISLSAVLLIVGSLAHLEVVADLGWILLGLLAAALVFLGLRRVFRKVLWSVGRRLLVSYLLLGLLPIPLLALLSYTVVYLVSGQMATQRVAQEIERVLHEMEDLGETAHHELEHLPPSGTEMVASERLAQALKAGPALGVLVRTGDDTVLGTGPWSIDELVPGRRMPRAPHGIGALPDGRHFFFVTQRFEGGSTLVYLPIEAAREQLQERALLGIAFPYSGLPTDREIEGLHFDVSTGFNIRHRPRGEETHSEDIETHSVPLGDPPVVGSGPLSATKLYWPRRLELPYLEWSQQPWDQPLEEADVLVEGERPFLLIVRSSIAREYYELFEAFSVGDSSTSMAQWVLRMIKILTFTALTVFFTASLLGGFLVFRIARAARRLSDGIQAVEDGRFEHRIQFRGHDQLSALVGGFNEMVEHLEVAVAQRAEQKALRRELDVAAQLQKSLLPKDLSKLDGLELAISFEPAAAIGGDFYQLIDEGDGRSSVVVADVSGHGLATGLVMASAQGALTALSRKNRSTPETLAQLDDFLRQQTESRTFVTLAQCRFDRRSSRVSVACAGHVYPYRVSPDGSVGSIGSPHRPLGLSLGGPLVVQEVDAPWREGDLWVMISDGFIEAVDDQDQLFGFERFEALLGHCAGKSAAQAESILMEAQRRFTGHRAPDDDRTLVVIQLSEPVAVGDDL